MGRQALASHCSGKKYKEVDVKVKTFFQSKKQTERDSSKSSQLESEKPSTCTSKTGSSIKLVINTSERSKAEIWWTLKDTHREKAP